MALTKVEQTTLLAITAVASATTTVGAAVTVATYYGVHVRIRMGRGTASAFTIGPKVRIEGTYDSTSPTAGQWTVLAQFQMALGANIASQALGGTEAIGQTTITLAAGTNFAAGDYVFFEHTTLANSEWARVVSVSGSDIVIEEGLLNEQTAAASICRDQSEQYQALIDTTSLQAIRLVVDGAGSGQEVICAAEFGAVSGL